jgi:hypothetical protein
VSKRKPASSLKRCARSGKVIEIGRSRCEQCAWSQYGEPCPIKGAKPAPPVAPPDGGWYVSHYFNSDSKLSLCGNCRRFATEALRRDLDVPDPCKLCFILVSTQYEVQPPYTPTPPLRWQQFETQTLAHLRAAREALATAHGFASAEGMLKWSGHMRELATQVQALVQEIEDNQRRALQESISVPEGRR